MRVEIWSDIACPWCYIGKARFEKGLAAFAHHADVEVVHRSYELDPGRAKTVAGTDGAGDAAGACEPAGACAVPQAEARS